VLIFFQFLKYMLTMGIVESMLKPISIRVVLFALSEYLPGVYQMLDSGEFGKAVFNREPERAKSCLECAFVQKVGRLPTPLEAEAIIAGYNPLAAAGKAA
jgi:hypothetical protein